MKRFITALGYIVGLAYLAGVVYAPTKVSAQDEVCFMVNPNGTSTDLGGMSLI